MGNKVEHGIVYVFHKPNEDYNAMVEKYIECRLEPLIVKSNEDLIELWKIETPYDFSEIPKKHYIAEAKTFYGLDEDYDKDDDGNWVISYNPNARIADCEEINQLAIKVSNLPSNGSLRVPMAYITSDGTWHCVPSECNCDDFESIDAKWVDDFNKYVDSIRGTDLEVKVFEVCE